MVTNTSYIVNIKDSVTLKCSVSGNPLPPSVHWIKVKDGESIFIKSNVINNTKYCMTLTENISTLLVPNADDNDAGVYQCIAENKFSLIQSEDIYVSVLGGNLYKSKIENKICHYKTHKRIQCRCTISNV